MRRSSRSRGFAVSQRAYLIVVWCTAISGCAGACSRDSFLARFNELRGDSYALDEVEREVTDAGVVCPETEMITYSGEILSFSPPLKVHPAFVDRLQRFERVTDAVARQYYARPPLRIVNAGSYVCRTVAHRPYRLSEHALGNAVDIVGFDFGALPQLPANPDTASSGAPTPPKELPVTLTQLREQLSKPLRVRVQPHWEALGAGPEAVHRRFLRALTEQLQEANIFRTMLGPSDPAHRTHLHFGMTPWNHTNL